MRSYYISKSYILSVLLTLETRKHEQMLQMYINVRLASSPKSHLSEIYIRLSLLQDLWGNRKIRFEPFTPSNSVTYFGLGLVPACSGSH